MNAVKYMTKMKLMCSYYKQNEGCMMCPLAQLDNLCAAPGGMTKKEIKLSIDIVDHWTRKYEESKK